MNQILHIFRKDVRHFWIEISGSLIIFVFYVWHIIHEWGINHPDSGFELLGDIWNVVMVLAPASWCLLIIRSIQGESLVGDRQFWITRPYEWWKLAAEKLLLVLVFIHLPLLVAHVFLLQYAGFSPAHHLLGILQMHLLLFLYLDLITAVIASVTSSIVQVLVWIVGSVLYVAGVSVLFSFLPSGNVLTTSDAGEYALPIAAAAWMLGLILFQFWRRTTWIARFVIIGTVLLLTALISSIPFLVNPASEFSRVGAGEKSPLTIQMLNLAPQPTKQQSEGAVYAKQVPVWFPMKATETEDGTMSVMKGVLVDIEAPDGTRSTSHWRGHFNQYWEGDTSWPLMVDVDRKFLERFRDTPVKVHFSFAITGYRETNIHQLTVQSGVFPVPGAGGCWVNSDFEAGGGADWIACMTPLQHRSLVGWFDTSASTCRPENAAAKDVDPNLHETLYFLANGDELAPRIIPVDFFTLQFSRRLGRFGRKTPLGICVGTPFTLATPESFRDFLLESELDGVKLSDYQTNGGNPSSN